MAKRSARQNMPDAVRDAVERTVAATVDQARGTRERAQVAVDDVVDVLDEVVRGAESVRERVLEALEERRPAGADEVKALRAEVKALSARVRKLEGGATKRKPAAKRPAAKKRAAAKSR